MSDPKSSQSKQLAAINGLVRRLVARIRLQRGIHGAVEGACLGLMLAAVGLAASRTGFIAVEAWWPWALLTVVVTAIGAAFRAYPAVDPIAAAQALDRTHGLHDRLSTAVSLARGEHMTAAEADFVEAQLRDALRFVEDVDPSRAAPFKTPADTRLLAVVAIGVIVVGLIPLPDHQHPLPEPFEVRYARVLDSTTLAMERDRLREIRRQLEKLPDIRSQELADEIERLLDAVENQEISEREFIEAIDELLERYFGDSSQERTIDTVAEALAEAARQIREEHAEALAEHPELEEVMQALEDGDQQRAADALSELAQRLDTDDLSQEEKERLADLIEAFSEHLDTENERLRELFEQHREQFEALAEQFEGGDTPEGFEDLLNDAESEMNRAQEELQNHQDSEARRQLERLAGSLEETAQELRSEEQAIPGGEAGEDAEGGPAATEPSDGEGEDGQDPDQADGQQQGDQQRPGEEQDRDEPDYRNEVGRKMDDAARQLEEMDREQQRQQQREEMRRQLEEMRESMGRGDRQDDERDDQRRQQVEDFMDRARGGDDGESTSDNTEGQMDGAGDDQASGEEGDADGEQRGDAASQGGPERELDTEAASPDEFDHIREELSGQDSGEGPSRSEIIRSASEDGFATTDYRDVFVDYEDIAQEVMEREEVPDGYRYYIQRYFQLIRPQD